MQIISDYISDSKAVKPDKGSYEWWYFDGLTNNAEYGFVVIFYEGNPFSRRYMEALDAVGGSSSKSANAYPALSISVYKNGKPVYYGFKEHRPVEALYTPDRVYGRVGNSEFSGSKSKEGLYYKIRLKQRLPDGDRIEGTLDFVSRSEIETLTGDKAEPFQENHVWNLVQPHADVEGELSITGYESYNIIFKGPGYHDHNLGMEPMDQSFEDWYWGRFHFEKYSFVYYLMKREEAVQQNAWLITSAGKVISVNSEISLSEKGVNLFGLQSARKIEIAGDRIRCFIQLEKVIDSGPFYQRFQSTALMETEGGLEQSPGFSEYIYPERIKKKIFWPLVDMRITYPGGRGHWVQRNPRLYRWTW